MADIRRQLGEGEELLYDLHPHWRRLVVPFLAVPSVAALATFVLLTGPARAPFRCAVLAVTVVVLLFLSGMPYLRWRTTRYVLTSWRVIGRSGIVRRIGLDVPLYRLSEVQVEGSLTDRLTRCGDLILETAGEQEQLRLVAVPRVGEVQRTIERLMEIDDRRHRSLQES